ncbi:cation transporter [candidate division KSB1 bacterium]|nr:cation transporter [candidate division KSB1 bacterium]RQW04486.1 MAG: cation transporter [candidate division KSB1 bacterium]
MMSSRTLKAQKVTWVGFFVNLLLSIGKLFAGIVGHSAAMVADGVHSISDFATDIIVLAFVRVADKGSDADHRYGHGKFETFATLLISISLLLVGIGICWSGMQKISTSFTGGLLQQPSVIALLAALLSILAKEGLYQYTARVGKSINNQAVIANAWHHRSDALSSIATLLGIGGAILLGGRWRILDPLAGILVSFFIMKVAVKLGMPSVNELLETALPDAIEREITDVLQQTPDVKTFHKLKTRKIGTIYAIDVHVQLDPDLSLVQSHDIATEIERKLRDRYGPDTQISIHTEPLRVHHKKND